MLILNQLGKIKSRGLNKKKNMITKSINKTKQNKFKDDYRNSEGLF